MKFHHTPIKAALFHQFFRRALLGYAAILQYDDVVRAGHRAHPVGNDQYGLALEQTGERFLYRAFVLYVQAGGGLIQKNDRSIL